MRNLKHTIAACIAVVLIGSLAVAQATDFSKVKANKINEDNTEYLVVSDATEGSTDAINIETEETNAIFNLTDFVEEGIGFEETKLEDLKPFEPVSGYVITTTGGLNIRAGESLDSEILDSITYGQMIDIIDETDDWYVIPYGEDGGVGYVLKEYVTTSYEEAKKILLESVMYENGVVSVDGGSLNVRSAAGTDAMIIDQIASGDNIIVLERVNDEWIKVYYGDNYGTGYVMAQYVSLGGMVSREEVAKKRIERINAISKEGIFVFDGSYLNCRQMPSEDANVIKTFANGDTCLILSKGSDWTKIAYGPYRITGYVKSEHIMTKAAYDEMIAARERERQRANQAASRPASVSASNTTNKAKTSNTVKTKTESNQNPAPSSKGQAIVNEAAKYIGVKYVWGGTSPSGFDCSGLVQYACKKVGISVNRTSRAQYSNGVAVSKNNLQPGDLVFFSKGSGISHVGIYAGNGQVIHAPSPGKKVCYIALSKICSYSTYVGARRVY